MTHRRPTLAEETSTHFARIKPCSNFEVVAVQVIVRFRPSTLIQCQHTSCGPLLSPK